jgi:hypothetical protein
VDTNLPTPKNARVELLIYWRVMGFVRFINHRLNEPFVDKPWFVGLSRSDQNFPKEA